MVLVHIALPCCHHLFSHPLGSSSIHSIPGVFIILHPSWPSSIPPSLVVLIDPPSTYGPHPHTPCPQSAVVLVRPPVPCHPHPCLNPLWSSSISLSMALTLLSVPCDPYPSLVFLGPHPPHLPSWSSYPSPHPVVLTMTPFLWSSFICPRVLIYPPNPSSPPSSPCPMWPSLF